MKRHHEIVISYKRILKKSEVLFIWGLLPFCRDIHGDSLYDTNIPPVNGQVSEPIWSL